MVVERAMALFGVVAVDELVLPRVVCSPGPWLRDEVPILKS